MTPYYRDDWLTVYHGDCRAVMAEMPAESVHMVCTSPPFWGLRDYGVDGQLGLEPTPEEYVANLVAVFREVRRVLRADGTVWLNLGDSYANSGIANPDGNARLHEWNGDGAAARNGSPRRRLDGNQPVGKGRAPTAPGLKPKDLVGIPWRVAFALQADGWYLRSEIIWAKPNPMPESVTDRPTKSHETIFLLSKSPRYYFDADAVREAPTRGYDGPGGGEQRRVIHGSSAHHGLDVSVYNPAGRNIRSVWTMATQPYPGAHFATFPETLPERCIKAGTSEKGVCPECGAPWERVVDITRTFESGSGRAGNLPTGKNGANLQGGGETVDVRRGPTLHVETTGWQPTCAHDAEPIPARVLDCFAGSGTTGMVAQSLSRRAVLIDLSLDYLDQLMTRNREIPLGLTS